MNFGQRVSLLGDEPFAPIKPNFELIQKLALDKRIRGTVAPKEKKDCEVRKKRLFYEVSSDLIF